MNNIGKLTTFSRLIKEESVIMIPKVQRDYAYGRKEEKVESVLSGMLTTMFEAVKTNTPVIFDFVYGGTFVKKNNESSGLIPLDGQQRLTTLFLLHFYASLVQPNVETDELEGLKKFRYETRQSATDFTEALIGPIRNDILSKYSIDKKVKSLIEDNPKYLPSYSSDPTIISMLNVIEVIESMYRQDPIDNLWTKLNKEDSIQFYSLSLDKFGLTDDLYIKMNSRGKKLTRFEIFKSDLEKAINNISPELKDAISVKIDNSWMDMLWHYAQNLPEKKDIVEKADEGFMCLFNNIFRIEMFRRGLEKKSKRNPSIDEIITDKESIEDVISVFDCMSEIHKNGGIQQYWDKYFYFNDDYLGVSDKIRLFWNQNQNRKPVLYLAMEKELTVPESVYFYAIYLLNKKGIDFETSFKCLRVVRNLVTANVRANSARYDMLAGFMSDVEEIVVNKGQLQESANHTFVSTSCDEEMYKQNSFTGEEYSDLLKFENHTILQASLMLFMNSYSESSELFMQLNHFTDVFDNSTSANYDKIRKNLIDKDIEYCQFDPNMENEENMTRRYFIHKEQDLQSFFIKNERRRNQNAILEIVANKLLSGSTLKEPSEKCKEFDIKDWKYYMVKYNSANREDTSWGCYAWDDKENRPLEMVILNSSYHSKYNIEWKMLNHILVSELWDGNDKYSLDPHASSPFVMNKLGITLSISQEGWVMQCSNENIIEKITESSEYSICKYGEEDNIYLVDFASDESSLDYIDLAKILIGDIENAHVAISANNE